MDQVAELYWSNSLGARRPVEDRAALAAMFVHANLVVTAWEGSLFVGIARSFSDFAYVTYLADLAVGQSHQWRGIGRELIRLIQIYGGPRTLIVLLAAPEAVDYYPRLGFSCHESAWVLRPGATLA